jgi:hypothetical protein
MPRPHDDPQWSIRCAVNDLLDPFSQFAELFLGVQFQIDIDRDHYDIGRTVLRGVEVRDEAVDHPILCVAHSNR